MTPSQPGSRAHCSGVSFPLHDLRRYMRQILGVHKKTTIMGLRAELGKYPLSLNIYIQIIKYWTRLLSTENILLHEAHIDNLERMRKNKPCWIKTVMFILKTCGLQQIDIKEISETSLDHAQITTKTCPRVHI